VIAYTLYLGPAFVLILAYVPNKNDQALLGSGYATRDAPADPHPQDRLLQDHPELADRPEGVRGRAVARQVTARTIGGTFEGISRKHMILPDSIRDSAWYAIVDDDWPRVRKLLETKIEKHAS